MKERVLIIAGPTAVGKTEVTLRLAEHYGGEVVSADSMQVYQGMDIGTAKPTAAERKRVVHHLLDVISPGEIMTVADYQSLARSAFRDIAARGRLPILSGGTGLYIKAAIDHYNFTPLDTDWALRDKLRAQLSEEGAEAMHARLAAIDPLVAARIHPNDSRRVVRALEVHATTGRPLSRWEQDARCAEPLYDVLFFVLTRPRPDLYRRIEARVDEMFSRGLVEEVRTLAETNLGFVAGQALGYKELIPYLQGAITLDEARENVKQQTRRYAKRQLSWFRADQRAIWVDCVDMDAAFTNILSIVANRWPV